MPVKKPESAGYENWTWQRKHQRWELRGTVYLKKWHPSIGPQTLPLATLWDDWTVTLNDIISGMDLKDFQSIAECIAKKAKECRK